MGYTSNPSPGTEALQIRQGALSSHTAFSGAFLSTRPVTSQQLSQKLKKNVAWPANPEPP